MQLFTKKLQKIKINIYIAKIYKNPLLKFIFISFTELNLNNFNSGFDDFPIVGESFFAGEVYSDFYEFSTVCLEREEVVFGVNLSKSLFGCLVNLELEDVDVVFRLDYKIYASVGCHVFHVCAEAH